LAHEERNDRSPEGEHSFAGYQVYDKHYEKIGKVDDLFVDENDSPEYVGVKMGFLGTKSTLIPIELVRVNDKRQLVEVAADKDAVKDGPSFGDDREITSEFERRVHSYYGVETARTSTERGAYGAYYSDATGEDDRVDLRPGERASEIRERSGATRGRENRERGGDLGDGDEVRIQRSEEELRVETREREAGGTNVRKRVRTDREQVRVPTRREEVHVERVPVEEREASGSEGPRPSTSGDRGASGVEVEGDEIRIPVIEEEIVVEKRPVVREEIRLRKEVIEEEEVIEEDVRKEEVDIEDRTERRNR
jgi:uncharacterized protein (TIGR02271 family)